MHILYCYVMKTMNLRWFCGLYIIVCSQRGGREVDGFAQKVFKKTVLKLNICHKWDKQDKLWSYLFKKTWWLTLRIMWNVGQLFYNNMWRNIMLFFFNCHLEYYCTSSSSKSFDAVSWSTSYTKLWTFLKRNSVGLFALH